MHLGQYIYFKLKSGGLFWKRDTKTLDLHTGQAYDQIKKHKLSRHVPPLKRVIFFQAEDGIRDRSPSRGLGDVYKRQLEVGDFKVSIVIEN